MALKYTAAMGNRQCPPRGGRAVSGPGWPRDQCRTSGLHQTIDRSWRPRQLISVIAIHMAGPALMSVTADHRLVLDMATPPNVDMDSKQYKMVDQFDSHFKAGVPSLKECTSFKVKGDVEFEANF